MLNGLDLFSGIGGISLALSPWVRTVAYCENDRYAQSVLLSRMHQGSLHHAPIWDDVRTIRMGIFPSGLTIDIICGGFPCQDISLAGTGKGLAGERSGLFFEIARLVGELRPRFVFLENVPAISVRGLDRVLMEFTALGYDCRWTIVSAAELGAPHLRERWFLLAHADDSGRRELLQQEQKRRRGTTPDIRSDGETQLMADSDGKGLERRWREEPQQHRFTESSWWAVEPDVGRVANGISNRSHRLKCLGNSVVPLQAREAFKRLIGIK
jgi:DNA (cytosine-5)-methyltransferase 1